MTASLNEIHLIGRVGTEPDMRYLDSGRARTRLRLATDRPVGVGREPNVDWHDVICWGPTAEFAGEYLDVGRLVFIAGRVQYHTREIDGQQRRFAEIVALKIVPLDRSPARPQAEEDDQDDHFGTDHEPALRDAA